MYNVAYVLLVNEGTLFIDKSFDDKATKICDH